MAKFISRGSENKSLVEAASKVPMACDALPDSDDKETMARIVLPITALVGVAETSGIEADQIDNAWKRAQLDRDSRDESADTAVRRAHARLVDWAGMKRGAALVIEFFPDGIRPFTHADDDQPDLMALLLESIAKATHAELTAERKAELESIMRPVIKPLADARDAVRIARLRRKLAVARYDAKVDAMWRTARQAYSLAMLHLPVALVESVFASMLVKGTTPAVPEAPSTPEAPTT